jgi:hypothetical protein
MPTWQEIDTQTIAARGGPDWSLERLLIYADAGIGVPVHLLVDGQWLQGNLASPVQWGTRLDEVVATALEQTEAYLAETAEGGRQPEQIAAILDQMRENSFAAAVQENQNDHADTLDKVREIVGEADNLDLSKLPDDLARDYVEHDVSRAALTLVNARLTVPATGASVDVGMIRVSLAHIAAWWPGDASSTKYAE